MTRRAAVLRLIPLLVLIGAALLLAHLIRVPSQARGWSGPR